MAVIDPQPALSQTNLMQTVSYLPLVVAFYLAYRFLDFVYAYGRRSFSPLRKLPGPRDGAGWIVGNASNLFEGENMENQQRWVDTYGHAFALRGFLGSYQLMTTDLRALTHIFFATDVFHKPAVQRAGLRATVGEGLAWSEDEQHRDQRRIINPAFGSAQVREMTPMFLEAAARLRDIWRHKCTEAGGSARLDALDWLSRATLDAIGKAGFDYEFNQLNEQGVKNELADSMDKLFRRDPRPQSIVRRLLATRFPFLRVILADERAREAAIGKERMDAIGMRIVQEKKQAILNQLAGTAGIQKKSIGGKDVISLLLKANLAEDLQQSQRLSDQEVLAQIPTFLVAGHETTANSTTWAMYELARYPGMQKTLRAELLEVGTEMPTLEQLNALPYLDKVVRETLRFHPVLTFSMREAVKDDVIPFGTPVKDLDGNMLSHIQYVSPYFVARYYYYFTFDPPFRVKKGDQVLAPIFLVNRSKALWGPDADKFRPERWDNIPQGATSITGIMPNLMSFIDGPRACVGHRFAVAEMKAFLFHVVRGFEFRFAVDESELWARSAGLMRLQLRKDNSVQLPLLLTPVA